MHEMSIASAILDLAKRSVPAGSALRGVHIETGPMRGIEAVAMQWAWQATTEGTADGKVTLKQTELPWRLRCEQCGTVFATDNLATTCACGCGRVFPSGGDELRLISIEVDESRSVLHASSRRRKCAETQ